MTYSPRPPLDPDLSANELAQIAASDPLSWPQILAHPNCYPDLAAWITNHANQSAPSPAASASSIPSNSSDGAEQMRQAAKQFAAGAQGFYKEKVAPSVQQTSSAASAAWANRKASPREAMQQWAPLALIGGALLGIIALFLPLFSYGGISLNYFSDELDGSDGPILLVALLVAGGFAVAFLVRPKKWLRITTGVVPILVGLFMFVPVINVGNQISGIGGASIGIGPIISALTGLVLVAAAILLLLPPQASNKTWGQ